MVTYQWNIFWANLNPVRGSEQSGKRPVLIISVEEINQTLPIVSVLPITSTKPGRTIYPTEIFLSKEATGLPNDSIAMVHQVRTISKKRLGECCGKVEKPELQKKIKRALKLYFGL
ncbi:MAG: type II toxin-antitoxin system PemK/MazF family toxin [Firmicutes bacterium]|nr:type II toxin-antitoxin system PemK/MazF family toxin [Bacillota bacterium]